MAVNMASWLTYLWENMTPSWSRCRCGKIYTVHVYERYTIHSILIENWYFIVPRLLAKQNFMAGTAIRLLLMSFLIVGMFWLCSRFMKRIIFFSILVVSASYAFCRVEKHRFRKQPLHSVWTGSDKFWFVLMHENMRDIIRLYNNILRIPHTQIRHKSVKDFL